MSEAVYTTGDVAKLVGVNFRTVIRWIERGELNGYKLPGRGDHRVTQSSLLSFINKHRMPIPEELDESPLEKKSVLVVDDEPAMARAIERVFALDGWKTYLASDGFQAGAMLMKHHPALMTLDLRMPGMDGQTILEFMKESITPNETKVLVVSAQSQEDIEHVMDMGADAALTKPFENSELLLQAKVLVGLDS